MNGWVLGCGFLIMLGTSVPEASRVEECPQVRPFRLTPAITPVIGQSPLWLTVSRWPVAWEGPDRAIAILFVRDRSVPGAAVISATERGKAVKARFGKYGSTLGLRDERFQLDAFGAKPKAATQTDLDRYSFHMADAWFPGVGCYEITARVGRQQTTIIVKVDKRAPK